MNVFKIDGLPFHRLAPGTSPSGCTISCWRGTLGIDT